MGKKDKFDFDGDMFPMDDFDMDDLMGGKIKPPKGIKAVFAGIKNFGKWWVKGTIDDFFPDTRDLVMFPVDAVKELGDNVRDLNDKYQFKSFITNKVKQVKATVKEEGGGFISSVKDGSFFTVSADDKMMAAMMGDSDDMFSSGGSSSSSSSSPEEAAEKRSKRTARAIVDGNVRTVRAIASSSEAAQRQSAKQFEVKSKMDAGMHSQMYGVVSNIAQNIVRLVQQNNMMIKANVEYSSKSLKLMSAQAKLLQDVRNAQWKQIGHKKVDITNRKKKITAKDIYGSDGSDFDSSNYLGFISQELKEAIMESTLVSTLSTFQGMGDMIKMSGGYTGMITGMIGDFIRKKMNNSIFGAGTRAMATRINRMSKSMLPALNVKFKEIAESGIDRNKLTGNKKIDGLITKMLDSGGEELLQSLLGRFIIKDGRYNPVKSKSFDGKEVHAFDNTAHKALTEVIPGLLSKIYAATSGDGEITFDYNRNRFITVQSVVSNIKETEEDFRRNAGNNSTVRQVKEGINSRVRSHFMRTSKSTNEKGEKVMDNDKKVYFEKIINALDEVVHNYMFYGYQPSDLESLRKWISHSNRDKGDIPYGIKRLTTNVIGSDKFKEDVVRHFIDNFKSIIKEYPQLTIDMHNAQNTYKSNMTSTMQSLQETIGDNTSSSHIYNTVMSSVSSSQDSLSEIDEKVETLTKRIKENKLKLKDKDLPLIRRKAIETALKNDEYKLNEYKGMLKTYAGSDTAKIVGIDSIGFGKNDWSTSRMMDIDSTSGLIKNIHDMILQGVIVYPNKMSDDVAKAYDSRRSMYSEAVKGIQSLEKTRKSQRDAEKKKLKDIDEDVKVLDRYDDDDIEVDEDGAAYKFLRKEGTVRGKFFGAMDKFTEGVGKKVLGTMMKFAGYDPSNAKYMKAMDNEYKTRKGKSVKDIKDKVMETAKDFGISEDLVDKVGDKFDTIKDKASDYVGKAGDKASELADTLKKTAENSGIISKAKDKTGSVANKGIDFAKESANSIANKLGFKEIFKNKADEATKIAEEAVANGEEKKAEVISQIVEEAQKNGLPPESEEVQESVEKAEKEIDNQTIAEADAKGGEVAAVKAKAEIKKAKLLRRHKHRLTGALAAIQEYGIGGIGKAISLFGKGWVGIGGKIRNAGKWVREKSSNFGLPGKIIGKTAGAMISGVGLATQGYGQVIRGVGAIGKGVGTAGSYLTKGIGHTLGFTLGGAWDISTYPIRKIHEIAKRVKAGRASKKEKQLIENAKNASEPEVQEAVKQGEQEAVAEAQSQDTSTEGSTATPTGETKEAEKHKGFFAKAKDMFGTIGSKFGFGDKEREGSREHQERLEKEKAKEAQEAENSENMKIMAEQMTNPKYGGIFVRFSKEGLDDQTQAMEDAGVGNGGGGGGGAVGALGAMVGAKVGAKVTKGIRASIGKKLGKTKIGKALGYSAETGKRTGFMKRGFTAVKNKVFKSSATSAAKGAVESTAKNAVKAAAKEGAEGVAKNAGKFSKFLSWISKFFNNKRVAAKLAGKGPKLLAFFTKMFKGLTKANSGAVGSFVIKRIAPLLGARVAAFLGSVGSGIGIAINVASFLAGFVKGAANTKRIFNLGSGIAIPGSMRLACGIAEGLNGLLLGIPGILIQLGGPLFGKNWNSVSHMIYDIIGSDAMKTGMKMYHDYNSKRAKIYGISDPQKLINFENGSDRGLLQKIGGWFGSAFGVADRQKAEALGFKSTRAFEEWKERKYQPLENLRTKIAEQFGRLKDLEALEPSDPEKTKKFREEFLREAGNFIKDRNLSWLTDKTTDEEVEAKLGKGRTGFSKFARRLGSAFGITQTIDKINASKTASEYLNNKNNPKADQPKDVQIVDAEGNVTTLNSTLDQEIDKYRQLASEKGITDKRFDKVKSVLGAVKDMGTVREALDAALNASDEKSAIEAARNVIKSRKNATASTNPEEAVSTSSTSKATSTTMTGVGATAASAAASTDNGVAPSTGSAPVTTSAKLNGSPAKTATLKLSSEMSDAFKWQKEQYNEQVRHDKITETAFVSMVKLLTILVNQNGGNANAVLDDLSRQIASS